MAEPDPLVGSGPVEEQRSTAYVRGENFEAEQMIIKREARVMDRCQRDMPGATAGPCARQTAISLRLKQALRLDIAGTSDREYSTFNIDNHKVETLI